MTADELQKQLARTENTVRALQKELEETNRGLVALTLELEQRVDERTAELRQLNQELEARVQERTAQLREANENLQNFAYTAAHDLRGPLRSIKSFSAIVLEEHGTQLDAEGQFLLHRVTDSASRMQHLLDDLLEYSKVGQADLKLEKVHLQTAVREALALLEADLQSKNATVTVEGALPAVIGHSATVVLLINNYISNALKFIADGVRPQLRIWAEQKRLDGLDGNGMGKAGATDRTLHPPGSNSLPIEPSGQSEFVRLWVEDNGIGIAPNALSKVFEVFQRVHTKGVYPGTGLGLAIVRKAAERMGGRVGVESQPGQGSRFWVELRRA